jgi:hypothetical protein
MASVTNNVCVVAAASDFWVEVRLGGLRRGAEIQRETSAPNAVSHFTTSRASIASQARIASSVSTRLSGNIMELEGHFDIKSHVFISYAIAL